MPGELTEHRIPIDTFPVTSLMSSATAPVLKPDALPQNTFLLADTLPPPSLLENETPMNVHFV